MPNMDVADKEKSGIEFLNVNPRELDGGRKVYDFETAEGGKFACWDADMAAKIPLNIPLKVKWGEKKNGQYTNRSIRAVAVMQDDGTYGAWFEQPRKSGGGGKQFDSEGANMRACLQAAATLVASSVIKTSTPGTVALLQANTIKLARELKDSLFSKAAASKPAPEVKKVEKEKVVAGIDEVLEGDAQDAPY